MTTNTLQKIGFQHVGSFLRPTELKQARENFKKGQITTDELSAIEDEAITDLVRKQVAVGINVVTDGEFRRSYWHLDNFWGFGGVERFNYGEGYVFAHEETRDDSARLSGKLSFNAETHPFIQHFKYLKAVAEAAGVSAKITIPAPSQLYAELVRGNNAEKIAKFYDTDESLYADIQRVYHEEIIALYEAGARTIQLDDHLRQH